MLVNGDRFFNRAIVVEVTSSSRRGSSYRRIMIMIMIMIITIIIIIIIIITIKILIKTVITVQ